MLPAFDDDGYLPPGLHRCTVDELVERFGSGSAVREVLTDSLRHYLPFARANGARRIVVVGSYVSGTLLPGDLDLVILPDEDYELDSKVLEADDERWPGLHLIVALGEDDFAAWVEIFFPINRDRSRRGNVGVIP